MDKQKNRSSSLDKTDRYLRTQKIRVWLVVLAGLVLVSGMLVWLFFGAINITVSGYAETIKDVCTYCAVPSEDIDRVQLGMTGWVDHYKGTVTHMDENYSTYDEIVILYGFSAERFHVKQDETYYFVELDITEANSGYSRFTIITDTVTPFEYYFGGVGK